MVTKSRRPRAPTAPPKPVRKPRVHLPSSQKATQHMRERFVLEYLQDGNGTQAAIRAGYSPRSAHVQASKLLKQPNIAKIIAQHRAKTLQPLVDRYEAKAEQITRELALLGFSNIADYGRVDEDGEFRIDFSDTNRDQFAAIQSVKTKRTTRYHGETEIEDVVTELRLAPKREALSELAKIRGLLKDGGDVTLPVRFIVQFGAGGPMPEPYPDEEAAA